MNKKTLSFVLFTFFMASLMAQNEEVHSRMESPKIFHLGIGMGINSNTGGLGALFELKPFEKANLSFTTGLGIGFWGLKNSIGIRYYNRDFPHKVFYGLNFTTNGGFNQISLNQETEVEDQTEKVTFDMHRSNNVALSIGYQFRLFRNGRMGVELGYSIPLKENAYTLASGSPIPDDSSIAFMDMLNPGGFMLGAALTFGVK